MLMMKDGNMSCVCPPGEISIFKNDAPFCVAFPDASSTSCPLDDGDTRSNEMEMEILKLELQVAKLKRKKIKLEIEVEAALLRETESHSNETLTHI